MYYSLQATVAAARFASAFPKIVVSLLVAMAVVSPAVARAECQRVRLLDPLSSIIGSAVWFEDGSLGDKRLQVLATNPTTSSAVIVSERGEVRDFAGIAPKMVSRVGGDFLFFTGQFARGGFQIRWLDESFNERSKERTVDFSMEGNASSNGGPQVLSPYDWAIVGDKLVAYGAVSTDSAAFRGSADFLLGFFSQQLVLPKSSVLPDTHMILPSNEFEFYLIGHPMVTSIGEVAYFLLMDFFPKLYRFDTQSDLSARMLGGFPGEDDPLPVFAAGNRPLQEIFSDIEQFDGVPVGLYSNRGLLYMLGRKPKGLRGETSWTITEMKPGLDGVEVVGRRELPTSANHLHLLFTPGRLIVFEKGAVVDDDGTQDTEYMLMISESGYRDLGSGSAPFRQRPTKCVDVN